jgi:hypothetical protein
MDGECKLFLAKKNRVGYNPLAGAKIGRPEYEKIDHQPAGTTMTRRCWKPRKAPTGASGAVILLIFVALGVCGDGAWGMDKSRYISISEIKPGMEGYFLTVFSGQAVQKYPLEVISVVPNWQPARDAILVRAKDPISEKSGAVAGCSGSPMFLDGRMAGALAAGFTGGKEPLYFVTPIEYMLDIGTAGPGSAVAPASGVAVGPVVDLKEFERKYQDYLHSRFSPTAAGTTATMPLVTSLPERVCRQMSESLAGAGFLAIPGGGEMASEAAGTKADEPLFVPGGVIAVPLLSGDMTMAATGTVTEVADGKIYAFGHSFTGMGPVDLPIATGTVHVVVPSLTRSFKFSSQGKTVGALRFDENCGILGRVGEMATLIPLSIEVEYFNDPKVRRYDCQMAADPTRGPQILQSAIGGAGMMQGSVPEEHTVRYHGRMEVKGFAPIVLDNVSSGRELSDLMSEASSIMGMLMNNRYAKVQFGAMSFGVQVTAEDTQAAITDVELLASHIKAGQAVKLTVQLQTIGSQRQVRQAELAIPADLGPGAYELLVAGADDYEKYLRKTGMYRFTAYDLETMVSAIRTLVGIRRDRIYVVLSLPASGLAIEQTELPRIPGTKALLMQDPRRTVELQPVIGRVEQQVETGFVVRGAKTMRLVVEPK